MAVAFVREAKATGTVSPLAVTIIGAASGNVLVAFISSNRGSSTARTVTGITCTNVTWTQLGTLANSFERTDIWYGVVAGGTSGTSVSITFSGTVASGCAAIVAEYSGVLTTGTIVGNTAVTASGTSTSPATGNFTPLQKDSLLLTAVGYLSGTAPSADTAWTDLTVANANTDTVGAAYLAPVNSISAQSASWTIGNVVWATVLGELLSKTITLLVSDTVTVTESLSLVLTHRPSVSDARTVAENLALTVGICPSVHG